MHFSKTYDQLLRSLPPELQENAIQYRKLKKVIRHIVVELKGIGLAPEILRNAIVQGEASAKGEVDAWDLPEEEVIEPAERHKTSMLSEASRSYWINGSGREDLDFDFHTQHILYTKAVYEMKSKSGTILPQLRVLVSIPVESPDLPAHGGGKRVRGNDALKMSSTDHSKSSTPPESSNIPNEASSPLLKGLALSVSNHVVKPELSTETRADYSLEEPLLPRFDEDPSTLNCSSQLTTTTVEQIIPLVHDADFLNILLSNVESVSSQLTRMQLEFAKSLADLATTVAKSCHPASVIANFRPYSRITTHAGTVTVDVGHMKNDLYAWREIFQLYVEAEVFEYTGEGKKRERSVEESERRLVLFLEAVAQRWQWGGRKSNGRRLIMSRKNKGVPKLGAFKCKASGEALEAFINLNLLILDVKKFSQMSFLAARKILKKHTKRAALPTPLIPDINVLSTSILKQQHQQQYQLIFMTSAPLHVLIQAIEDTLISVIPSLDDYSCLICTSIAFKPIRLDCGHIFCVRCLVKLQRKGKANCPMCRAPCVLIANSKNVDWAMLNFMQDWFPREAKEKLRENEREVLTEELLDWDNFSQHCIVM